MEKSITSMNKFFTEDKLKHVIVSAVVMVMLSLVLPKWVAGLITLSIGVGKEVYDKVSKKGCCEWKDIMCDLIGIVIGVL